MFLLLKYSSNKKLLEAGIVGSIGDSIYRQKLNPQEQMEEMIDILSPLARAGLIIGLLQGNHCNRILNATSIDIAKLMAKMLNVSYLGYAGWTILTVGKINYLLYASHGSSGSKFKHTKLKAVMDTVAWIDADIIAMGHMHSIVTEAIIRQTIDLRSKTIIEKKTYVVITGSYIGWSKSYAEMKNYPITKIGSPKAKLSVYRKDIHFSL